VTLKTLAGWGRRLLSLSGQHEFQTFLAPDNHLGILDTYGDLGAEVQGFSQAYQQWLTARQALKGLRRRQQDLQARQELAAFQLQELEQAGLQAGEEDELSAARERLRHAARLGEAAHQAFGALYAEKVSVLGKLGEIKKHLETIAGIEPAWGSRVAELHETAVHLDDLALALRDYLHTVRVNPQRLQEVEQRLDVLQRLKRKYGPTLEDVLALRERLRQELAGLENLEADKLQLAAQVERTGQAASGLALALSRHRREAAPQLAQAVEQEIHELAMPLARFSVAFLEEEAAPGPGAGQLAVDGRLVTARGLEGVEFFLAPNPGEDPKPLARIASGGELSRLVLGLKNLLAREAGADTMVFDEVDAGIGGATAGIVGQKLQRLARHHQVICITHLPQIACYAQGHFKVAKSLREGRTFTTVESLNPAARLQELARMLGGAEITQATLAHAREMLAAAGASGLETERESV
jgi:DNA repair protein RecN (Recombination protein N)